MNIDGEYLPGEEWRDIAGYPNYRVSNMGRVQSNYIRGDNQRKTGNWRLLKGSTNAHGHRFVSLFREGQCEFLYVHRLVLEAFVGPRPAGMEACHGNGIANDNRLENLRWDTHMANEEDKRRLNPLWGLANAKLTVEQVTTIKRLLVEGNTTTAIAKQFSVSRAAISMIKRGLSWTHVYEAAMREQANGETRVDLVGQGVIA